MRGDFYKQLTNDLDTARAEGLFKEERIITSAQQADITVADGSQVINFCANNYLGLANHPELIAAAKQGMDTHGFGMASVRFICGTQDSHKQLEKKLADFGFFRIHKSYLINLPFISELFAGSGNGLSVHMKGYESRELPVGREKLKTLKQLLKIS